MRYAFVLICVCSVLVTPAVANGAADNALESSQGANAGLGGLDWLVIGLYAAFMIGVGWYYSRRQTDSEEYFLGSRNMKPSAVGLSMYATLLSTITYLASPGEMIKHGPGRLSGLLALPVIYLVVGYVLIPVFMRMRITSAYEILEQRLGIAVRLYGSAIFMLTRLVWMALLVYVAAKAMVTMLGMSPAMIPYIVIIAGLIAVAYTFMGGLRAVVITDVFQFIILFGGAVLTIVFISVSLGGVSEWWPTSWAPNWDHQPFFSWDPHVRLTVVGTIVAFLSWWICTAGSDQVLIQRYLATRDAAAARRAFLVNTSVAIVIGLILPVVGFALLGFFRANPQYLGNNVDLIANADYLFPHYVANYLPAGVSGLVVAAMFAAAMSSLDSGINSIVTVFTRDFLVRLRKGPQTEQHDLKTAKYLVLGIGTAVVLISSVMGKVPGNIVEVTTRTGGLFAAPLFGLFFMALFVRFATPLGAIGGSILGLAAAILVAYWDSFTGGEALSFQWIYPCSLVVSVVSGLLLSLLRPKRCGSIEVKKP